MLLERDLQRIAGKIIVKVYKPLWINVNQILLNMTDLDLSHARIAVIGSWASALLS